MQSGERRKLSMAVRVLDFATAHPSTDAGYNSIVSQLEERITKADALVILEHDGRIGEHAAVTRRNDVRRQKLQQQLRHIARVARLAAKTDPEFAARFRVPSSRNPLKVFITAAKATLAAAAPGKDLLVSLGLGPTFLGDLAQSITAFDAATQAAHAGKRDHIGAAAELKAMCQESTELIGVLDGIYRDRFAGDSQTLAEWASARNVIGPFRAKPPVTPAPGEPGKAA